MKAIIFLSIFTAITSSANANLLSISNIAENAVAARAANGWGSNNDIAREGVSNSLAMAAALPSGDNLQFGQTAINFGTGHYDQKSAFAVGFARKIGDEAVVRAAVAYSGGKPAVSAGFGWKF